ncbi:glycosyl hydrolase [Aureococcus anophagefferens]|nr:glycosyl hydrolase [Aureococcus anophagefferens]
MEPVVGYGWSRDTNCFPANSTRRGFREGARRHAPVVGAYNASNVSVVGGGVIDGRAGEPLGWWDNCALPLREAARPAFPPTRPSASPRAGPPRVENVYVNNSDDGVCMKSGLDGFGINLAIPTEDVLVRNITCDDAGRGGFAVGSEMSGGVRNVTFRDSANGSACYNLVVEGDRPDGCVAPDPGPPLPAMTFSCKRVARTLFGEITLPWPVCVPREAPVNVYRDYPNWGPARGAYPSLGACKAACH